MPYANEMQFGQKDESFDWMRNPPMTFSEGQFSMDLNTLMFVVNQTRMPTTQCLK